MITSVFLLVGLLFCSAFFAAAETAFFSLPSFERKRIESVGGMRSRWISKILSQPTQTLSTILIGNMLVNTTLSCLVTMTVTEFVGIQWLSLVLGFFTFFLLMFGEIIPKNLAIQNNVFFVYVCVVPLRIFSFVIYPIQKLLLWIVEKFFKMSQEDTQRIRHFTDEEFECLIEMGEKEGVLKESEVEKISNIISFGERKVKEIMRPRTDMIAFDLKEGREALLQFIMKNKADYVMLYHEDLDAIEGAIISKEFLLHPKTHLNKLVHPPVYVPELVTIDSMIRQMAQHKRSVVVCVDEYGGTAGMVSQEQVIEAIFGKLHGEEHESENVKIEAAPAVETKKDKDGFFVLPGTTSLYELKRLLELEEGIDVEHYDSLSGFILDSLGEFPEKGKVYRAGLLEFIVVKAAKNRIKQVKIRVTPDGKV